MAAGFAASDGSGELICAKIAGATFTAVTHTVLQPRLRATTVSSTTTSARLAAKHCFHNSPRPDSSRNRNCCSRDRVRRTCLKNLSSSTRHPPSIPARQRNPIIPSECREKKKHWHRPLLAQVRNFLECSHPQKARIQGEASRRRGFCSGAQSPPRPRHRIYLKQDAAQLTQDIWEFAGALAFLFPDPSERHLQPAFSG